MACIEKNLCYCVTTKTLPSTFQPVLVNGHQHGNSQMNWRAFQTRRLKIRLMTIARHSSCKTSKSKTQVVKKTNYSKKQSKALQHNKFRFGYWEGFFPQNVKYWLYLSGCLMYKDEHFYAAAERTFSANLCFIIKSNLECSFRWGHFSIVRSSFFFLSPVVFPVWSLGHWSFFYSMISTPAWCDFFHFWNLSVRNRICRSFATSRSWYAHTVGM